MPAIDFLLQGLDETNDHFAMLDRLLDLSDIQRCLISVAFMNASGAGMVVEKMARIADQLQLFVGIRNGITSKQSIEILRTRNIYPICVDTATQAFIFHPKVYLAQNKNAAILIAGSANFTTGGLIKNIEAILVANLDFANPEDTELTAKVIKDFETLRNQHPENVFQLDNTFDLDDMVRQGLLEDETAQTQKAIARAASRQSRSDQRPRMNTRTRRLGSVRRTRVQPATDIVIPHTTAIISTIMNNQLLWKSKPLVRRALSIPNTKGTNQTGSMLFTLGDPSQNINPRKLEK